ncbi:hypothetical protein ACWDSF_06495 [Nocardia beijingensis]
MTTTELPAWEAQSTLHRLLPPMTDESVHDPAYLAARLTEALAWAESVGAEYGSGHSDRKGIELELLRSALKRLTDELRVRSTAGEEFLAVLKSVAPGLHWERGTDTFVGHALHRAPFEVAETAARALRLGEPERMGEHIHYWTGCIEGWRVQINHHGS